MGKPWVSQEFLSYPGSPELEELQKISLKYTVEMTSLEGGLSKTNNTEAESPLQQLLGNNPELRAIYEHRKLKELPTDASGHIVSEGHSYLNNPRIRDLVELANAIRDSLPHVPEGNVRLWRGNRRGEVGHNPSYTNSLEGIALPFLRSYGGVLSYVDVPQDSLQQYLTSGAKDSEFFLPPEIAKTATLVGFSTEEAEKIKREAKGEGSNPTNGWTTLSL